MIGFLSQLGYVIAYAVSGAAADAAAALSGQGVGRGAAMVIVVSGICLSVTAAMVLIPDSIRKLEIDRTAEETVE